MKPISDARTCKDGCKYLRGRLQLLAVEECSALQVQLQCTAGAVAVHCGSGCSALRLRWVKLAPKLPVLFYKVCQTTKHKNRHFMA